MRRHTITPQGLERLVRQFQAIPERVQREVGVETKGVAQGLATKIKARAPRRKQEPRRRRYPSLQSTVVAREERITDSRARTALGMYVAQLRRAAGISWRVVAGFPGRFVEFGTKASPGDNGVTAYKNQRGKWRGRVRKPKRAHAATRPFPFFWPTVRAERSSIISRIKAAANRGAKAAVRDVR